ncbi:MAG: SUMF1/EgtB/PvdO family nonheme iron enzyme, partial [Prosthecobacter sp.]
VMSFKSNALGIFDLGGNVREQCSDRFTVDGPELCHRDIAWNSSPGATWWISSCRGRTTGNGRWDDLGFRIVAEKRGAAIAAATPSPASSPPPGASAKPVFTNSLGMQFVPVPGTDILMCIHETRRKDYAAYAAATPGLDASWKPLARGLPVNDEENHPAASMTVSEAKAFCDWLGKKDGRTYRLPTDREWSFAVGIGSQEQEGLPPEQLNGKIATYPWGDKWPPEDHTANLPDEASSGPGINAVPGYKDRFITTAPVMSFKPNALGLYDLSGNVWEFTSDLMSPGSPSSACRGGAWRGSRQNLLLSSGREGSPGMARQDNKGFRLVVENAASTAVANPSPPASPAHTNSLGMKFVPVPGTKILMCIHETRRQDYEAYAKAVPNVDSTWVKPLIGGKEVKQAPDHPVMRVSWNDAMAFCGWIGAKEGRTYRLPTAHEFDLAVAIHDDPISLSADDLNKLVTNQRPWTAAGLTNYRGFANFKDGDTFPATAPVMSFEPSALGLYDTLGNVWEWSADQNNKGEKLIRGCGYLNFGPFLTSGRTASSPADFRGQDGPITGILLVPGFRVVIEER